KQATLFFSQDSAMIAAVIPAMDKLDNKLKQQTKNDYHPAVISAMQLTKNKMDQYWQTTDLSNVYHIAMDMFSALFLHPGLKLEYFCTKAWEQEWIETAKKLVHDKFANKYEKTAEKAANSGAVETDNNLVHLWLLS
ncbi:hypothetical protein PAXRUDRAFT_152024, partial [Paxillus rubicundulus Ve08.2h10]